MFHGVAHGAAAKADRLLLCLPVQRIGRYVIGEVLAVQHVQSPSHTTTCSFVLVLKPVYLNRIIQFVTIH